MVFTSIFVMIRKYIMSVSKSNSYIKNVSLGVERIFMKVLNLLHVYI